MEIVNHTGLSPAFIPGRLRFPEFSVTFIIKGTYQLEPGGVARLLPPEAQQLPTADLPYPDDEDGSGPPRYESDFAYLKRATDLLLVGKCHPPSAPAPACPVRFAVGAHAKSLEVIGDRRRPGDQPAPFVEMELRYQRAARSLDNPLGTKAPPNIIDRKQPQRPAGFGPLSNRWRSRTQFCGTYTGRYQKERWPWLPEDFDWRFFNAAPADMQVPYLRGDETILLEGLHPDHPSYRCSLPGARARCFVTRPSTSAQEITVPALEEVPLHLDTLWVDAEAEQLVLVWRGVIDTRSEEMEDIRHLFVHYEPLAETAELAAYQRIFAEALAAEAAQWAAEPEPEPPALTGKEDAALGAERAAAQAELDRLGPTSGAAPAGQKKPKSLGDVDEGAVPPTLIDWSVELPATGRDLSADEVQQRYQRGESLAGFLLPRIDLLAAELPEADLHDSNLFRARLDRAVLSQADLSACELSQASLVDADLRGAQMAGAMLAGACLENADLRGADLQGAVLTGAKLAGARLDRANLSQAVCAEADLTGASLSQACAELVDLTGAKVVEASLREAILIHATAAGADFTAADLTAVRASGADLSETNLTRAKLGDADLAEADLRRATLDNADLSAATLRAAAAEGASAVEAKFSRADLRRFRGGHESDFSRADLRHTLAAGSLWGGANLSGANFAGAELCAAVFNGAQLDGATLAGADCRQAQFRQALLRGTKFDLANLFMAVLEKADLTKADLRLANCYGAEFLAAKLDGIELGSANLKRTKLAGRRDI